MGLKYYIKYKCMTTRKDIAMNLEIVDFTDDEFRGMLGYIIGYTNDEISDEYKELRTALINEVKFTTGKDLTKCWIWR